MSSVANYGTGSVCVLPVEADGRLDTATALEQHTGTGPNQSRQDQPHAHSFVLDPANRFAFACDLGIDKVMIYQFDAASGTLTRHGSATLAPGSGPRHLTFSPDGNFAYVVSEMLSTITVFGYDSAEGKLTEIQTISTLPSDWTGINKAAEVRVHPSGKFVYASNRGIDSLVTLSPRSRWQAFLAGHNAMAERRRVSSPLIPATPGCSAPIRTTAQWRFSKSIRTLACPNKQALRSRFPIRPALSCGRKGLRIDY